MEAKEAMTSLCCLLTTLLLTIAPSESWNHGDQKRLLLDHLQESACKDAQADISFLLDMSSQVGSKNFQLEKEFVKNFVEGIPLGHDKFQIGVGTYSSDFHEKIDFHSSTQKEQLKNKVNNLQYIPGSRNVYSALTNILRLYTLPYAGERTYASRIIFLITSGPSSSGASDIGMAESIRNVHNASIFVIQVGDSSGSSHNSKLVGNDKHMVVVKDFNELKALSDTLFNTLCHDIIIGAHCVDKMAACPLWPCTGQIKTEHCPRKCGTCKDVSPWIPITTTNRPSNTPDPTSSMMSSTSTYMTTPQSHQSSSAAFFPTSNVATSASSSQSGGSTGRTSQNWGSTVTTSQNWGSKLTTSQHGGSTGGISQNSGSTGGTSQNGGSTGTTSQTGGNSVVTSIAQSGGSSTSGTSTWATSSMINNQSTLVWITVPKI